MEDGPLLQKFVREKSQAAFGELVGRHSHWVYSVCRRRLGDAALAEDATQAVFLALARKAPRLVKQKTISPWLYQAARFCALRMVRDRSRRRRYELEAAAMKADRALQASAVAWMDIESDLEPALDRLGVRDRAAILLRFYEQKTHPEIAATLGISLEASQKRLSRAIHRLRGLLEGQGNAGGLSAMVLGDLLVRHGVVSAPASLVGSLASSASTAATCLTPMAKGIVFKMNLFAMKTAVMAACLALLVIAAGLSFFHASTGTAVLAQAQTPAPADATTPASAVPAAPAPVSPPQKPPATAPVVDDSSYRIPNLLFRGNARPNEYSIGLDPDTKRTANSVPAGYIKSLLPQYNPNNQNAAQRVFLGPYNDLHGKRVRLSGWLKTRDVEQWCGMELVALGKDGKTLLSDDMPGRPVHGTTDWTLAEIVVDVPAETTAIGVVSFMYGKGEVWSDDFRLQAVGPDVALTDVGPWHPWSFFAANYTAVLDPQVQHDGHATIHISSGPDATGKQWFSYDRDEFNVERFAGNRMTVTVWMKSRNVSGGSGVWISVFGPSGKIASDGQIGHRPLRGTRDWAQYSGVVDVPEKATSISWGIVMNGTGEIWLDVDEAKCDVDDTATKGF